MSVIRAFVAFVFLLYTDGKIAQPISCVGNSCYTLFKEKLDFGMSLKACKNDKGNLMSIKSTLANEALRDLLHGVTGDFWIGLRLPEKKCSNISSTLRGYEWKTRDTSTQFTNWKGNISVCSLHCVSVSSDLKWTERPCQDKVNGFICENSYVTCASVPHQSTKISPTCVVKNADCEHQNKSAKLQSTCICPNPTNKTTSFLCRCKDGHKIAAGKCTDIDECLQSPCQHMCLNTPGSYICKCRDGFVPKKNDQTKCEQHCATSVCPAVCKHKPGKLPECTCPAGYILDSSEESLCLIFNDADSTFMDNTSTPFFTQDIRSSSPFLKLKPNFLTLPLFSIVAIVFF
ncbi:complement component C1q receptor-like [Brienomyrus brachyistius]|uniref:complement component C1q receptor-like n=1 Tax=Brienomyrus brachyistius TaxID=42636 RepID=UPI0020B37AE7|nr:complement component C1q receptor-like [Brienomyrus brachyistius]